MILYLVQKSRFSLTNTEIMTFFPDYGYTDYFRFQMIVSELVESGQLLGVNKNHRTTYFITDAGRTSLEQLDDFLPPAIVNDLNAYLERISEGK